MIIFVGGTDTGVGKTVITGILARFFKDEGYKVITQKWVQTGFREFDNDILTHLEIMGKKKSKFKENKDLLMPYRFKFAASPHLASKLENKTINVKKIISSLKKLENEYDIVLVEGVGGMMVPLNSKTLLIDLVKKLKIPVLLVASNKLGTINHTLLTIDAINSRKIDLIGIIFNNMYKENKNILEDNPKIIEKISKERVLGVLNYSKSIYKLYNEFKKVVRPRQDLGIQNIIKGNNK